MGEESSAKNFRQTGSVCVRLLALIKLVPKLYPDKSEHEESMCYINDGLVTSTYVCTDEAASAQRQINSTLKSSI